MKNISMSTAYMFQTDPHEIGRKLEIFGVRYTYWYLTDIRKMSVARAIYMILLSW